jgi:serine/threonine-protein kinase
MHYTELKNHRIQSELGRGGMAIVYLAHDNKFDTKVAVKVLNKEFVHNENIRKRFIAEARKMFKMSHTNIIKVTDLIDEGDTVAFVMEYVEGETLKEYLDRKGKLTDAEIKDIFSQMLDAVGYVHEQKLVHRDIKPSNFMLDKSGRVKLMDFGIAKNTDVDAAEYTQTGTGMQMGTPMYMSPEQITETKSVTAQSDVYSLGVVLWQLVTGQKPYDTKTLSSFQLQTKIVTERLAETHTSWDGIIQQATAKEVDTRYRSCVELKLDLTSPKEFKEELEEFTQIDGLKTQVVNPVSKDDFTRNDSLGNLDNEKVVNNNEKIAPKKELNKSGNKKSIIILLVLGLVVALVTAFAFFYNKSSDKVEYESILIGCESGNGTFPCQKWMVSNLNVETFRNGDPIPEAKTKEEWEKAGR